MDDYEPNGQSYIVNFSREELHQATKNAGYHHEIDVCCHRPEIHG